MTRKQRLAFVWRQSGLPDARSPGNSSGGRRCAERSILASFSATFARRGGLTWLTRLLERKFRLLSKLAETGPRLTSLLKVTKPKMHLVDEDVANEVGVDADSIRKSIRVRGGRGFLDKLV